MAHYALWEIIRCLVETYRGSSFPWSTAWHMGPEIFFGRRAVAFCNRKSALVFHSLTDMSVILTPFIQVFIFRGRNVQHQITLSDALLTLHSQSYVIWEMWHRLGSARCGYTQGWIKSRNLILHDLGRPLLVWPWCTLQSRTAHEKSIPPDPEGCVVGLMGKKKTCYSTTDSVCLLVLCDFYKVKSGPWFKYG